MWNTLLLLYWVNWYHCHDRYVKYFYWIFMILDFPLIMFSSIISSFIITLDYIFVSVQKLMSVLNVLSFSTMIWGRFEWTITLSLFDIFEFIDFLLLTCELMIVHLLFLKIYKITLTCFLFDNINSITIYSTFVK